MFLAENAIRKAIDSTSKNEPAWKVTFPVETDHTGHLVGNVRYLKLRNTVELKS